MPPSNEWLEPRTLVAAGSLVVALVSVCCSVVISRWSRRESRLDALAHVLDPMLRTAQALLQANNCRRKNEELRASFPDPEQAPEAAATINGNYEQYSRHIEEAVKQFRDAEALWGARSFRFPAATARIIIETRETLSEYARLVNEGLFEKSDLQLARFRDQYKKIVRVARGWRLADPFEWMRIRFSRNKKAAPPQSEFALTQEEMEGIMELVTKRATSQAQNTFAVHPPKKLIDHPNLASSDDVIEELKDSIFVVRFQDGTSRMLSLVELMVFTYQLIVLEHQHQEATRIVRAVKPEVETRFTVSFEFSEAEIMRPEMVKTLMSKITFADSPSDA